MFKIFRTSSKKGEKKKKGTKSHQTNDNLNREVNPKPDDKLVENTDIESKQIIARKDSIPIGINWVTQPSPHNILNKSNSINTNNDGIHENSSTPSRVSSAISSRVSHLTENSDVNVKERNSTISKSSNTTSVGENLESNNKSNRNSINCENNSHEKVNEVNLRNNINHQATLQGEIISNTDIKQSDNESSSRNIMHDNQNHNKSEKIVGSTHENNKSFQDILELLLTKFNNFEEIMMVEINSIKESQDKQEKRLQEIQNTQEIVTNTLTQIMSKQFVLNDKQIDIDVQKNESESENEYPDSIAEESKNISSLNTLPTIQEADINVEQSLDININVDQCNTDPQSPSISSSLTTSTISYSVESHTSEQSSPSPYDLTKSPETISDLTDVNVSTCDPLSKSLPTPSPATPIRPFTSLSETQHQPLSTIAVHNSMSNLDHVHTPVNSNNTPVVPSPFRSSNPPIKHSPPNKPKRLSLQIPMSSSPSQESEAPASCPLRRSIDWPDHSPLAPPKTSVSSKPLRKVHDRDMRMFITITP
ncbi:unnamed protein product [Meganyctiphanes norvegica]|uniref:Uncharacterized protein n=1 Tax=Meganyctiphanes norvegica TaxID=48144 RepID=A0AAV2SDU3_MEGNR